MENILYKNYIAQWIDSSISHYICDYIFDTFHENAKNLNFALITSLDSDCAPSLLLEYWKNSKDSELKLLADMGKPLGNGILLPTATLVEVNAKARFFYGFDEIWFFKNDRIKPKPLTAWLVGPYQVDQKIFDQLGSWLIDNDCLLGLGDGCGLNTIVKIR